MSSDQRRVDVAFNDLVWQGGQLYALFTVKDRVAGTGAGGGIGSSQQLSPDTVIRVPLTNPNELKAFLGIDTLLQDQTGHSHDPKDINRFIGTRNPHGRVILYDDFADPALKWKRITSGGFVNLSIGRVSRSFNRSYVGKASLHLQANTGPANTSILAARSFTHFSDQISVEYFFTFNDVMRTVADGQAVAIDICTPVPPGAAGGASNQQRFRIEYRPSDSGAAAGLQWNVFDGPRYNGPVAILGAAGQNIAGSGSFKLIAYDNAEANAGMFGETWHQAKLIVDRAKGQYIGAEFDNQFIDLSQYKPLQTGLIVPRTVKNWSVFFSIATDNNLGNFHAYIDAVTVADESLTQFP